MGVNRAENGTSNTRNSWWSQAARQANSNATSTQRPAAPAPAPARPATPAPATPAAQPAAAPAPAAQNRSADAAHVSPEATVSTSWSGMRRAMFSALGSALGGADQGIENATGYRPSRMMETLSTGTQDFFNGAGRVLGGAAERLTPVGAVSGLISDGSTAVGGVLDLVGAPESAQRTREAGATASNFLNQTNPAGNILNHSVQAIVGDSIGGGIAGIPAALANPTQTLQGLDSISRTVNPASWAVDMLGSGLTGEGFLAPINERMETTGNLLNGIGQSFSQTAQDHGYIAATARAAFEIAGLIGTAGGSGAVNAPRLTRLATTPTRALEHLSPRLATGYELGMRVSDGGERYGNYTNYSVTGGHGGGEHGEEAAAH